MTERQRQTLLRLLRVATERRDLVAVILLTQRLGAA